MRKRHCTAATRRGAWWDVLPPAVLRYTLRFCTLEDLGHLAAVCPPLRHRLLEPEQCVAVTHNGREWARIEMLQLRPWVATPAYVLYGRAQLAAWRQTLPAASYGTPLVEAWQEAHEADVCRYWQTVCETRGRRRALWLTELAFRGRLFADWCPWTPRALARTLRVTVGPAAVWTELLVPKLQELEPHDAHTAAAWACASPLAPIDQEQLVVAALHLDTTAGRRLLLHLVRAFPAALCCNASARARLAAACRAYPSHLRAEDLAPLLVLAPTAALLLSPEELHAATAAWPPFLFNGGRS